MNWMEQDGLKHVADGLSFGVLVGTLANVLPSIATTMTIIWMAIRIWESDTGGQVRDAVKRLTRRKD